MPVTTDDLGAFLRQPTPREVPANIRRRKLRGFRSIFGYLFGGCFALVGGTVGAVFFPWRFVDELRLDLGQPTEAPGVVMASDDTNLEINDARAYRIQFRFTPAGSGPLEASSYCTGGGMDPGAEVTVEYLSANPRISRIRGDRLNAAGYWPGFLAIFPLVGATIMFFTWRGRSRMMGLLRRGAFANGRVTQVVETNVTVNEERRHKVTVEFDAGLGPQMTVYPAYGEEVAMARRHLADGDPVGLLYDPANPRRVFMAETLLGG